MKHNNTWTKHFKTALFKSNDPAAAIAIKNENLPKSVFKYRSLDNKNHVNALTREILFLSSPKAFNDPFEFYFHLDQLKIAKAIALKDNYHPEFIEMGMRGLAQTAMENHESFAQKFIDRLCDETRVCSFASESTSILMWSHYSDHHTGFCIEYDTINNNLPDIIFPVIYSETLCDLTNKVVSGINGESLPNAKWQAALTKHHDWHYEREWRLIAQADDPALFTENGVKFFNIGTPKAIYLGIEHGKKAEYLPEILSYCGQNEVPIFEMKRDPKLYKVQAVPYSK